LTKKAKLQQRSVISKGIFKFKSQSTDFWQSQKKILLQDLQTETAAPIPRAVSLKRHVKFVHWLSPANSVIIWYHRNLSENKEKPSPNC